MAPLLNLERTVEEGIILDKEGMNNTITEENAAGRKVTFKEYLGSGTFSQRYIVEIGEQRYFAKMFRHSSLSSGSTSRDVLRNEIYINRKLREEAEGQSLRYQGYIEIDDIVLVLYDDVIGQYRATCLENRLFSTPPQPSRDKGRLLAQQEIKADKNLYSLPEVVSIISQTCREAERLHQDKGDRKGLVHMDITSANIMVGNDLTVTLIDLGIAREKGRAIKKLYNETVPGAVSGSYYTTKSGILYNRVYSPPDIELYDLAEATVDTYNITNILCLMLTGRLREYYQNSLDKQELRDQLVTAFHERFSGLADQEPPSEAQLSQLAEIIMKGTSAEKGDRYATAQELYDALESVGLPQPQTEKPTVYLPLEIPEEVTNYPFFVPAASALERECENALHLVGDTLDGLVREGKEQLYAKDHLFRQPSANRSISELIRKAKKREASSFWESYITSPAKAFFSSLSAKSAPEARKQHRGPPSPPPRRRAGAPQAEEVITVPGAEDVTIITDNEDATTVSEIKGVAKDTPPSYSPGGALSARSLYRSIGLGAGILVSLYAAARILFNHSPEIRVIPTSSPVSLTFPSSPAGIPGTAYLPVQPVPPIQKAMPQEIKPVRKNLEQAIAVPLQVKHPDFSRARPMKNPDAGLAQPMSAAQDAVNSIRILALECPKEIPYESRDEKLCNLIVTSSSPIKHCDFRTNQGKPGERYRYSIEKKQYGASSAGVKFSVGRYCQEFPCQLKLQAICNDTIQETRRSVSAFIQAPEAGNSSSSEDHLTGTAAINHANPAKIKTEIKDEF